MIKVAVVDDEQKEREGLQEFFHTLQKEVNEEIEVVLFPDGEKLLEGYDASWDLICLDIEPVSYTHLQENGVDVVVMPYPAEDGTPSLEYMLNGFCIFKTEDEQKELSLIHISRRP